jgi:hypothetical protein
MMVIASNRVEFLYRVVFATKQEIVDSKNRRVCAILLKERSSLVCICECFVRVRHDLKCYSIFFSRQD